MVGGKRNYENTYSRDARNLILDRFSGVMYGLHL